MHVVAGGESALAVLGEAVPRQGDQVEIPACRVATDVTRDLVAVELGQTDVDESDIGGELERARHPGGAIDRLVDLVAEQHEELTQHRARVVVVLDDENPPPARRGRRRRGRRPRRGRAREGKPHGEGAAPTAAGAHRLHCPAVQLDETAHQREADPEPALGAIERPLALHEEFEDAGKQLGRDPHAGVADRQESAIVVGAYADVDRAPRRRVLEGVGDEVRHHLLHAGGIHADPRRGRLHGDRVVAATLAARERGERAPHDVGEVERLELQDDLPRHHPGHVEEVVHETAEVLDLALDDAACVRGARLSVPETAQHVDGVADGAERIPQLVAEHGQELVLGAIGRVGVGAAASCRAKSWAFWMATAACSARRTHSVSSSSVKTRGDWFVR